MINVSTSIHDETMKNLYLQHWFPLKPNSSLHSKSEEKMSFICHITAMIMLELINGLINRLMDWLHEYRWFDRFIGLMDSSTYGLILGLMDWLIDWLMDWLMDRWMVWWIHGLIVWWMYGLMVWWIHRFMD